MNELALFAGAAGGILGGRMLGWRTVCAVELDDYARRVIVARQDDGSLAPFPIWDDVRTFDGRPWTGLVDVISGGFPCQDISIAGRGAGLSGERSGLWSEFARIIREVGPRVVFVENSPALTSRGLGDVLGDLAALGFDAEWGVLGADAVGAPHRRERIWVVAHADRVRELQQEGREQGERRRPGNGCGEVPDADCVHVEGVKPGRADSQKWPLAGVRPIRPCGDGVSWWATEPDVGRMAHGVAARVDRLRCLGNGQVPQCAAEAFLQLASRGGWAMNGTRRP